MNFPDGADLAVIDAGFHPLELGKVFLLMANDGFDMMFLTEVDHLLCFLQRFGYRLFQ